MLTTTKRLVLSGLLALAVVASGCASKAEKERKALDKETLRECPNREVQRILATQQAITQIKPGKTSIDDLPGLGAPAKVVTLAKNSERDMKVGFYATSLPGCRFMLPGELYTPVIVDGGLIVDYGKNAMRDHFAKGWNIVEQRWSWQSFNYGYLPPK